MKEVKPSKKPLLFYYGIVLLCVVLFNAFIAPMLMDDPVKEVDYGTFMRMVDNKEVDKVQVNTNEITFMDKEGKVYYTSAMEDPDLTQRLYESGAAFDRVIEKTMSPLVSYLITGVLPIILFVALGQYLYKRLMSQAGGKDSLMFGGMGKSNAKMYVQKEVVDDVLTPATEISLDAARKINKHAELGDLVNVDVRTQNFGRIAAQTAKQVIMQRIREAERGMIFDDYITRQGEIVARTPSAMVGYFKNPEATKEVFTADGWFRTGDLGELDKDGWLYIKGRLKNMIVGPGGENIYPEDIETVLNSHVCIADSIVTEQEGRLIALVHFNREEIESMIDDWREEWESKKEAWEAKTEQLKKEIMDFVNAKVNRFSRISEVVEEKEDFIKTPTHKIKRFLYNKNKNGQTPDQPAAGK